MTLWPPYALGACLLAAAFYPAPASAQSTRLVVTEGTDIGYTTVAAARAALESQGLLASPAPNGGVSFVESDESTAWTFTGKDDPAYPSAVKYVYTKSSGVLYAQVTIRCEAAAERCEKFRSDIRDHLAQLSKMMAGDPSARCSVNENTVKCGGEPEGKPTP